MTDRHEEAADEWLAGYARRQNGRTIYAGMEPSPADGIVRRLKRLEAERDAAYAKGVEDGVERVLNEAEARVRSNSGDSAAVAGVIGIVADLCVAALAAFRTRARGRGMSNHQMDSDGIIQMLREQIAILTTERDDLESELRQWRKFEGNVLAKVHELEAERDAEKRRHALSLSTKDGYALGRRDGIEIGVESGSELVEGLRSDIRELEAENARLAEIVERLPKNASGDPVCIGMNQYAVGLDPCDPDSNVAAFGFVSLHEPEDDGEWWGDVRGECGDEWRTSVCRCYSTREAAEAAASAEGGE